jgi:hypothetical protein
MRMLTFLLMLCAAVILGGCAQPDRSSSHPPFNEFAYDERDVVPNDTPLTLTPTNQHPVVGVKKVLVTVVNWQGETTLNKPLIEKHTLSTDPDSLRSYILAASNGKLILDGQVISHVSGPRPELCKSGTHYPSALATQEGEKAARANGLDPANFDFLINVIDCGGAASAQLAGRSMNVYGQAGGPHVYKHEFGHNLGYHHGDTYTQCPKTGITVIAPSECSKVSLGDTGDTVSGGNTLYPAKNRWFSGWLDNTQSAFIERTGLYRLGVLGGAGPQLYLINRPGLESDQPAQMALEYRKPTRFDNFPPTDNRVTGVWVRYTNIRGALYNTQLDGTPETATTADPTLQPGRELSDSVAGIYVCSADASGATIAVTFNDEARPSCTPALTRPLVVRPYLGQQTGYRPIVSGTGMPGMTATIEKIKDDYLAGVVGSAIVGADGKWSTQIDQPLPAGSQYLAVYLTNPGSPNSDIRRTWNFTVIDTPDNPALRSPEPNDQTGPSPTFSGTGLPGATVYVERMRGNYLVGVIATAVVNEKGEWSAPSNQRLPAGTNRVAFYQTNGDKRSPDLPTLGFTVVASQQSPATEPPKGKTPKDQQLSSLVN